MMYWFWSWICLLHDWCGVLCSWALVVLMFIYLVHWLVPVVCCGVVCCECCVVRGCLYWVVGISVLGGLVMSYLVVWGLVVP